MIRSVLLLSALLTTSLPSAAIADQAPDLARESTFQIVAAEVVAVGGESAKDLAKESPKGRNDSKADKASEGDSKKNADPKADEPAADSEKEDSEKEDSEKEDSEKDDEKSEDADDKKKSDKKKKDEEAKPHKVERKPLKIETEIDGIFVADQMQEVALRPETWSHFRVVEAVAHGTRVKKGDVLVRFDDEKILKELDEQSLEQHIGELDLRQEEEGFPRLKRLLELGFEEAKRLNEYTKADVEYYESVDRPFSVEIAHFRYKQAVETLASQREELEQLEKMYEADDLTEETEEIVLRRQRFQVELYELILKLQEASRDHTLNVSLPRSDEHYRTALEKSELTFEQAKTGKEVELPLKTYRLEKKRASRAKSVDHYAKLLADKSLMVIRSPADGVVYYGRCINGKWSQVTSLKAKLKPFGSVSAKTVMMTIVKQRPLRVEAKLTESQLPNFKVGMTATIKPKGDDELKISGKVAHVEAIPAASNKFGIKLEMNNADAADWLVAGMTCKAAVTIYEKEDAIVIPADLVQTDDDNDQLKYVMLVDSDEDEPIRRKVKLGRKKDKLIEVLKGLKEGDEIVKEKKKDDK